MRISIIGPVYPYRGGIAHHTTALVEAARRLGHSLQIISFRRQYPAWLYPGKSDRDPSQKKGIAHAEFTIDSLNPITWIKTAQNIQTFQPDVVVFQWWNSFWSPCYTTIARLLRGRGLKVIFLVHNVMPHEERFFDRPLVKMAFRQADGFIVQSESEQQRLVALLPAARILNCPHPIYDLPESKPISKADARQALGIPLEVPLLLFFGIVRPYKGLSYLIDALGMLQDVKPQPHLLVAGEFWEQAGEYRSKIAALHLVPSVHLIDRYIPDEEVPALFAAADIFVAPYINGTQSGAIKLAMGAGLPLILTQPLVSEAALANSRASLVVPPADASVLAKAIRSWALGEWQPGSTEPSRSSWDDLVNAIIEIAG